MSPRQGWCFAPTFPWLTDTSTLGFPLDLGPTGQEWSLLCPHALASSGWCCVSDLTLKAAGSGLLTSLQGLLLIVGGSFPSHLRLIANLEKCPPTLSVCRAQTGAEAWGQGLVGGNLNPQSACLSSALAWGPGPGMRCPSPLAQEGRCLAGYRCRPRQTPLPAGPTKVVPLDRNLTDGEDHL
jgi:hypothetical protein